MRPHIHPQKGGIFLAHHPNPDLDDLIYGEDVRHPSER